MFEDVLVFIYVCLFNILVKCLLSFGFWMGVCVEFCICFCECVFVGSFWFGEILF